VTAARAGLMRQSWRQAVARAPDSAAAYLSLSKLLPPGEALSWLARAYVVLPESNDVVRAYAQAAAAAGEVARCRAVLLQSLRRDMRAETLADLAVVEARAGLPEAAGRLRQSLALDPSLAGVHFLLGNRDAAATRYRRAISRDPRHAGALVNLANLLRDGPKLDEALGLLRQAVLLYPGNAVALFNLGNALHVAGEAGAACLTYRAALAVEPRDAWRIREATLLPPIPESAADIARWRARMAARMASLMDTPLTVVDPARDGHWTNFHLAYHDADDRALQEAAARLWRHACPALATRDLRRHDGRPRLGFVSAYFKDHTIGHLFEGTIAAIDRERFRVVVVQAGPAEDAMARRLAASGDEDIVLPADLAPARDALAAAGLDALFYPDIGMDPLTYYLAHARLAPLQMASWGHPVTTGLDSIDLFVSAEGFDRDGAEGDYTERLARLPSLLLNWQPEAVPFDGVDPSRLGLDGEGRAYLCAQSLFKLHPDFDPALAEILRRDPDAVLHFIEGHRKPWCRRIVARIERHLPGAGARIRFLPRLSGPDFIRAQALADVVLDTPGFSGGKTSLEAFSMGQPVVTLPSRYLRGRLTHGFYGRMGLADMVATSLEDYVARAVRTGTDRAFREEARGRIASRAPRLWGDLGSVRAFEDLVAAEL
jgi:protein O-GlcNAc transferase